MMPLADVAPDRHALALVGPGAVCHDLQHRDPGQFGHHAAGIGGIGAYLHLIYLPVALTGGGVIPAEDFDEQGGKGESRKVFLEGGEVEF